MHLCIIIIGLQNCNDDCSLTFAGSLFNEVWKTCSVIMVYTSSQELATRSVNEVISTLLDNIAKTTKESKVKARFIVNKEMNLA